MSHAITVNGRTDAFPAQERESILEAGRRAGFAFPQACRNGNCFRCEGTLLSGEVEHLRSHERSVATDEPQPVLPCIVAARSDCALAVEGVYGPGEFPVREVSAQVVAVEPLTPDIARVRLRLPAGRPVARLAGQYLEIRDGERSYAFSIAVPPESGRDLELHIRHGEDNPSSLEVMALLRAASTVALRLPLGDCTLAAEPRLPLLFVAGSTGFSQVKAFVEHALAQRWTVPITVCWGARRAGHLYLAGLAMRWSREHGNICFVPVVAEGEPLPEGRAGLVPDVAAQCVTDADRVLVYACGSPSMVYATLDALVAHGVPAERIFSDVFAWAPRAAD
jgi:CDP-4-dehydro-6-deoxyglucose reductase